MTTPNAVDHFDEAALIAACELPDHDLAKKYGATEYRIDRAHLTDGHIRTGADRYWFKDTGARVLAVAHLDTVCQDRTAGILHTADGPVIHSGALDDRLGAYVIADLLPKMGMEYDLLFTTGEEDGLSTARFFDPSDHHDRTYDWIIQFDRGAIGGRFGEDADVVLYQYDCADLRDRVEATGAEVGEGIFSDISYLDHLGVKAMNWGVAYRDYHGPRAHAWLNETFEMVDYYALFHEQNEGEHLPHPAEGDEGGEVFDAIDYDLADDCLNCDAEGYVYDRVDDVFRLCPECQGNGVG